jgi:hypothetical protein
MSRVRCAVKFRHAELEACNILLYIHIHLFANKKMKFFKIYLLGAMKSSSRHKMTNDLCPPVACVRALLMLRAAAECQLQEKIPRHRTRTCASALQQQGCDMFYLFFCALKFLLNNVNKAIESHFN